ncbi:MAG: response regulator transcription factor [Rhodospirillales bacterium]|nr:MAG: response regulator transcription factor [Rhodospirillales bacterium]
MRLLLVEDEAELARLVRANLAREGFAVDIVRTLDEARAALSAARYDVILLDLTLPDGDGLDLLAELRRSGDSTPVIAVTARDAIDQRIHGLNLGADDYLGKPYAQAELVARIRALLRRPNGALGLRLTLGNLEFDASSSAVHVGEEALPLPRRELALLELLIRRSGQVVTRPLIENGLYGFDDDVDANAMEASVSRLRKRLLAAGASVTIHTVRGVGYMLTADKPPAAGA